jgi:hypothetical protein
MSTELDSSTREILQKIGLYLREQRKLNSNLDYKVYAKDELEVGMNTYLRMENGSGDYHISNLIKVINHYSGFKLSEFFAEAGL